MQANIRLCNNFILYFNLIAIKLQLQRLANKKYLFLPLAVKSYTDLKKNKYHIICTWALLLFFVAGQYMVYTHTHAQGIRPIKSACQNPNNQPKQTVTENCPLCDAMHHNTMAINSPVFFAPVVTASYFYKAVNHHFISTALILSAGRSPPMA
jgi:hypothetical protein